MECNSSPQYAQLSLYTKGTRIWIPCSRAVWREAEVTEQLIEEFTLKVTPLHSEEELTLCVTDETHLPPLKNPEALMGDSDLTSLCYLHEPAVLASLEMRYAAYNLIYTWCGIVLIAINPYQEVPLYAGDLARAYSQLAPGGGMDPHVYAVAEEARRRMALEGRDQSIVVTGESGAGKTVSACHVMRYFADVTAPRGHGEQSLEERVLACNPLLEAFGNAKTIRNDNSSRFGKYIELCFDRAGGLSGARLNTYLLEKTRVVQQSSCERNYHIFYQLCAGRASCPLLKSCNLSASSSYSYLTGGGSMAHAINRDDIGDLSRTMHAMSLLGLSDLQVSQVVSLLSGILQLGNIEITSTDGDEAALQLTSRPLISCASLWGVSPEGLSQGMLQRHINTSRDRVTKSLTQREAISCRDGFAKFLYGQLFRWLVSVINDTLSPPGPARTSIGVLDIYGFESLEINSFEQLCINYANEKLQLLFTEHVFRLEQEEYMQEGIHWSYIPFSDNVPTLQLIEAHLGVLDLLDESCQMPRATDSSWAQKLHQQQSRHARYQRPKTGDQSFRVLHYAGWVEYQGTGFLEKNRDPVAVDLVALLRDSSSALVCELGDCPELLGGPRGHKRTSFRSATVANQFRKSLTDLVDKLRHTTSHYIRCIKPNNSKQAFAFQPRRVVSQLRACGVLETVRISTDGFPSRLSYPDFLSRYSLLLSEPVSDQSDPKGTSSALLAHLLKDREQYQLGRNKVFLRTGAIACLERERSRRLETAVVSIQALARGVSVRRSFRRVSRWVLLTQARARGCLLRRSLRERRDLIGCRYKLIEYFRERHTARQTFLHSLVRIQATIRRVLLQRQLESERVLRAVLTVQRLVRGFVDRERYRVARSGIILLQACVRRRIAQRKYTAMKASRGQRERRENGDCGLERKIFQLQRRLSVKEQENTYLKRRGEERPLRSGRGSLERSFSVRHTKPRGTNLCGKEDLSSLKKELDLERQQRSLDSSLHRQQVEQLRLSHREEREQLTRQIEQLTRQLEAANQKELSDCSMEFEIVDRPGQVPSHPEEELLRSRRKTRNQLRESSPSGRSSGGIESGIDVSSVTLDQWDRVRAELESERDWVSGILEKFSPSNLSRPLCDLLTLLSPQLEPPPPSLMGTERLQSLLQLIRDVTELRHDLSMVRPAHGSLSFQAIPEDSSVGHKRKNSLDTTAPRSRAASSLLTSSLTSSLLGGQTDPDTECLLQQVSSLKLANQLLHRELETGLGALEEQVRQKDSEIHKLQQKIAALRSMSYGPRSPMEAKLQQEISRLTQENMDVTSELESVQENLKTLQLSPSLSQMSPTPSVAIAKLPAAPCKRGLLLCPREHERTLIRTLVQEMRPQRAAGLPPGLPAHLLFMAIRSADERQDERQVEALLSDTIRSIRQVSREGRQDLHLLGFWLCNVSALIGDLKQFSGEDAYQVTNNEKQRKECLQNFDLTDFRYLFNELCIGIYHDLTTAIQDRIHHLVVPALLEHEAIPTVAMSRPSPTGGDTRRSRGSSRRASSLLREEVTIRDLVRELSLILDVLRDMGVSAGCVKQLMRQIFYFINAVALNNILLRKDLCHWSRGLNVRYSLSQLEDWTRSHAPLIDSRALDSLLPLTQAAQLLQINKRERDAAEKICGACCDLSPLQIQKLLTMYTPANEFEERVPPSLIRAISQHFNLSLSARPNDRHSQPRLMQDISLVYPPTFPYSPSPLLLSQLEVPPHLDLGFLRHL